MNRKKSIWTKLLSYLAVVMLAAPSAVCAADLNILIIGSQYDSSKVFWLEKSRSFPADKIRTELQNILNGAGVGTANVVYEDRYKYYNGFETFNFASWFHWPYPAGATEQETESNRWANLRGEAGTDWDYVILIDDPYTMEKMPGLYAHGVAKVSEEVTKGGAETILLMPWPSAVSDSTVAHYKEVVYRVGRSGGFKVAPAALARESAETAGHVAAGLTAGSDDGAYLCAASLYSRIWNQSASSSTYVHNDTLADSVHTTVTNNIGAQQYTGKWDFQSPFKGFNFNNNSFSVRKASGGTSTEDLIMAGSRIALENQAGVRNGMNPNVTFYNGRNSYGTTNKSYKNKGDVISFGYEFPTEKRDRDKTLANIFSLDIVLARAMRNQWHEYRLIPHRLMAAGMLQHDPAVDIYPGQHMYGPRRTAIGTYIATILTGYCPMYSKPATITNEWMAQKIGYEMAWNVSTLQARAPGFKVNSGPATVGYVSPTSATVEFILKPKADVTVTVTSTIPGVTVSPQTLTFTPDNHATPQDVTFLAAPGAVPGTEFNLEFNTSSDDEVCNDLYSVWTYTVTGVPPAPPVAHDQAAAVSFNRARTIVLTATDPDNDPLTYTVLTNPTKGTLTGTPPNLTYTPNVGATGADSFTFKSNDGLYDSNTGTVSITVSGTVNTAPVVEAGDDEVVTLVQASWTPAQANVRAWYDASDPGTIVTTTTGTVSQWNDKSGNDYHLTQSDDANQPTTGSRNIGGLNAISFDGISDHLNADSVAQSIGTNTFGIYCVFVSPTTGKYVVSMRENNNDSSPTRYYFARSDDTTIRYQLGNSSSDTASVTNGTTLIASLQRDSSSSKWWLDGAEQAGSTGITFVEPYRWFTIGALRSGTAPDGTAFSDVVMGELIVADTSTDARQKIEGYLAHKWGQVANLPGDHPYKSATNLLVGSAMVGSIELNGTATDADNDPLTTIWSKVDGPGDVTFSNASSLNTTATFTVAGQYTLSLAAYDGYGTTFDTVIINVTDGSGVSAFTTWSSGAEFSGDANGDGVANGLAWVLGADGLSSDLTGMMPTVDVDSEESYLIFEFRRSDSANAALGAKITAQYCGDLDSWNTAVDGQNGVVITSADHPTEARIDMVTVKVPKTLEHNGALFMRLRVTE